MTALNIPSQPGGHKSRCTCDLEGSHTGTRDGPDQIPGLQQGEFPVREPWIQEGGERVLISLKAPAPSSRGEEKSSTRDKEEQRQRKGEGRQLWRGLEKKLLKSARLSGKQESENQN